MRNYHKLLPKITKSTKPKVVLLLQKRLLQKRRFIGSTSTLHRYCSAKVCIIFQKQKQFDFFSLKNAKSFIFLK